MIRNLNRKTFLKKFRFDTILFIFIFLLLIYSIFVVWSASEKNILMLEKKIMQIFLGLILMFIAAQFSPKQYEKISPYLYLFCILLLILVKFFGTSINGARRWLNLGLIHFQPSEITKISVPMLIARIVNRNHYPPSIKETIIILIFIFIPTILIAKQPDLGTAILISASGLFSLFFAGISWKFIVCCTIMVIIFFPMFWFFLMHDYQRYRIIVLFNPEIDPKGSGYHIFQSKIAIGSGGIHGKGWLRGTQSILEFLPEKHTDFIFSVIGEELGFIGIIILLVLYLGTIFRGFSIALSTYNVFNKIIVGSFISTFFSYIFVNIGMVSGILPVVGIPLPLISYGGSETIVLMFIFGIIMSVHSNKKIISRNL